MVRPIGPANIFHPALATAVDALSGNIKSSSVGIRFLEAKANEAKSLDTFWCLVSNKAN